mgnify:FL=1
MEVITRWIGSSIHVIVERHEEREIRVYFAMMQGMESNNNNITMYNVGARETAAKERVRKLGI